MDQTLAPTSQPPASGPSLDDMIDMDIFTCTAAFLLLVTHIVIITRFRIWYSNPFLKKLIELANNPVIHLINTGLGIAIANQHQSDLYMTWVVLLLIAFDNVFTISCYSLLEQSSERRSREYVFLYNCILTGSYISLYKGEKVKFYLPLLVLWSLVVVKFLVRIIGYVLAEKAYGLENINLIADYMKSEHNLTDTNSIDPTCMQGYKYLVLGEERAQKKTNPDYTSHIELTADIVTVERVWSCKVGLLDPSVDKNGHLKDVCLSFALFKLLRRQYFGYPAAEAQKDKIIKQQNLVFAGLLTGGKERVFRVVKMELGFLRDFFFTRYPVSFAMGFPVINLVLVVLTLGVTIWIAIKVFEDQNPFSYRLYYGNKDIDLRITDALLILIAVMEIFEALSYVFSDWTKVILVSQNVRSNGSHVPHQSASSDTDKPEAKHWQFGYKVLAYFCKPRFSLSVKSRVGQYSLLHNCNKISLKRARQWTSFISTCRVSKLQDHPQKKTMVQVREEVKNTIFDTLAQSQGHLTNGTAALQRNGMHVYEDLSWALNHQTPVHTIMVWHIATCFCAGRLERETTSGFCAGRLGRKITSGFCAGYLERELRTSNQIVATQLSDYCAYLVAFLPDLLPFTESNSAKYMFQKIVEETSELFKEDHELEEKFKRMMEFKDGGPQIIQQGSKLGIYLVENIADDVNRWKILADFWSEFILYLAPYGSTRVHIKQLGNGSEFITHLWALLYHAGLIPPTTANYP